MTQPLVLVCAGGTAATSSSRGALRRARRRGCTVDLVTDERAEKYGRAFPARTTHIVSSATIGSRNPLDLARAAWRLGAGYLSSRGLMRRLRPVAVVGFGGYPTLPPMFAATQVGVPTVIHDQNAVMGRANRQLSARVTAIATSFPGVLDGNPALAAKATFTGNPVRPMVIEAAATAYDAPRADGPFRLCVFGGSQGARVMSEIVPPALEQVDALRARLAVVQQARAEDRSSSRRPIPARGDGGGRALLRRLPARLAAAHLVIARSGASTVAELSVIGRPSILVPLPTPSTRTS